jgi:hypothetical protein
MKLLLWYQEETVSALYPKDDIVALCPKDDIYQAKTFLISWLEYAVNLRFLISLRSSDMQDRMAGRVVCGNHS